MAHPKPPFNLKFKWPRTFFSSDQYFPQYNKYCKAEKEKLWKHCLSHAKQEVKVFYNILKHLPVKLKWEMRPRQLHRETYPRAMGILRESQVQEITFNNLGKKTWILKRQLWNIFLVENFWKSIALDIAVHWSGPANNWFEWFSAKAPELLRPGQLLDLFNY